MKLICLLTLFVSLQSLLFAQTGVPEFGDFTRDDLALKECAFDKNADAVIIFETGLSNYNDEYNLVTEKRVRMKILKEKGIDRANIRIRFYSKDKFESITRIKGVTGNVGDNGLSLTKLDPKTIYTRKLNDVFSEIVFAMPNVKVGSIIEYSYESIMEHYGGLDDWYFQQELPVMLSSYKLYVVPDASFNYLVKKSTFLPISIVQGEGNVVFEMKNIAGLRDEAYSTSYRDYLQRVSFQLSSVNLRSGSVAKYGNDWKELAKNLAEHKDFGGQINKNISTPASAQWASYTDPYSKMQFIYNYVRRNFQWNNIYSIYSMDGLKPVVEKKRGTAGDLNLLMINMLKEAGLEVYPLLVSERDHGRVDSAYSFIDQFNKVVALVRLDGGRYILDATDYVTPCNMIPGDLLNTVGFVVDKKKPGFIHLNDNNKKRRYFIRLDGQVSTDGIVKADAQMACYDYARLGKAEEYNRNKQKYMEQFSTGELKIDSFNITGVDSDSVALQHDISVEYSLGKSGSYYLLKYNLFTGFDKNPFIADYRFTDIDFGAKYSCVLSGKFKVPEQFVPDALPKNQTLRTADKQLQASREIKNSGDVIEIFLTIDFNAFSYSADDYDIIKDFFSKMTDMLNEPVILKLKQ